MGSIRRSMEVYLPPLPLGAGAGVRLGAGTFMSLFL